MKVKRRMLATGASVLLVGGIVALGSTGAHASSTACLNLGPGCGSEVDPSNSLGWNPAGGNATLNNPVNAYPDSGGGTGTDWLRTQPVSGEYQFQYAPSGTGTGLCASDPGGGVSGDPGGPDGIILRTCNTMGYQYFKIGSGNTLVDLNTGLPVKDNGQSNQLVGTSGATTQWNWQGGSSGGGGGMNPPPGFTTKVLDDSFTGTSLNTNNWNTYVGDRGIRWNDNGFLPSPYSGFNQPGASGQAMYAPSQLSVNNGLTITAQRNNSSSACGSACATYASTYPWVSGTINTEGKFTLPTTSSWYVQANIKMPDTSQGMWPAMWFLCGVSCSPENELDGWEGGFDEIHGVPANQTAHYDYFSNAGQQADEFGIGTDVSQGYHVYGVQFIPNTSITYFFDGHQEFQVTAGNGANIPAEPYEIMLNEQVAAPGTSGYHTVPNANTPSTSMQVAEVQAYTP